MPTDADPRAHEPRPLPANPNLEFERKRAKKLLREMRTSDPGAKLADAQFAIAREYGFLGWPLLVQYFQALERRARSLRVKESLPQEHADVRAQSIMRQHARRLLMGGVSLATWVPRFYGRSPEEVLDLPITLDDARLVVARMNGATSWEDLLTGVKSRAEYAAEEWRPKPPPHRASEAVFAHDLDALKIVCEEHPEMLDSQPNGRSLLQQALLNEWRRPSPGATAVTAWLASRGGNIKDAATRNLLSLFMLGVFRGMGAQLGADSAERRPEAYIEYLLSLGADPNWMPPSGISVLEDVMLNCWCGAAVDLIARRVAPRKAFWIAAGVGDVRETRRYFEGKGKLRAAARRYRPDFAATSPGYLPSPPGATDAYLIFEAAYIALLNQRFEVVDLLLDHGLDLNAKWGGMQLLGLFVANPMVDTVEYLISRGADPQEPGIHPASTSLELAASNLKRPHPNPVVMRDIRRIYELCGGTDPDGVVRTHEQRTVMPAVLRTDVADSLERARGDAAELGQATVEPLNLFISLLRDGAMVPHFVRGAGTDMEALRSAIGARIDRVPPIPVRAQPPVGPALRVAIDDALAEATKRKAEHLTALPMVVQLVADETGEPAKLIVAAGGSLAKLRESLTRHHH